MPVRWNTATPSAEVVTTSVGVDSAGSLSVTCAPARAADCGSTTLILSSAAEAAASKRMKHEKTRENRMHSSFSRERGLVWTVRAGLLAWRVRISRISDLGSRISISGYPDRASQDFSRLPAANFPAYSYSASPDFPPRPNRHQ